MLWFTLTYTAGIEGYMTALSQLPPGPPDQDHLRVILEAYDTMLVPRPRSEGLRSPCVSSSCPVGTL